MRRREAERLAGLLAREQQPAEDLGPLFRRALERGESPYNGFIHPSEAGQRLIGEAMLRNVLAALKRRQGHPEAKRSEPQQVSEGPARAEIPLERE